MNNVRRLKICLGIFVFFISCNTKVNSTKEVLKNANTLRSKEIGIDFLLGKPSQITLCNHVLVITDQIEENVLALYDSKEDFFLGRQLKVGQGPNEVILPLLLSRSNENDILSLMQRQDGRYIDYDIAKISVGDIIPNSSLALESADRFVRTDDGFITFGPYEAGSISIRNSIGNVIKNQNIYPKYINDLKRSDTRYVYGQGHIAYNRENNVLAFAPYYLGEASFYKLVGDSLKRINSFDYSLSDEFRNRIINSTNPGGIKDTDIEYFSDIYATSNHFYLLYTGVPRKDKNTVSHSYIFKFSAKGDWIDSYKTDCKIISFCVQDDDEKSYALALSQELDYILIEMQM